MSGERGSVQLHRLVKRFGRFTAVDGIDLNVEPGEFLSLLGPIGSGKTTTLRLIAGFEQPNAGDIVISGQSVRHVPAHRRDVNTVFKHYALFPHMTVAENVAYGLRQRKTRRQDISLRVGEALEMVRMSPLANRKPRQITRGQQQRVALARALVNRPSLLLLDEPLGALDSKHREEMWIELKLIQSQVGITCILVTHDQQEALSLSDRIGVMLDGRFEQIADPHTIYDSPASAFVAGFIGQQNFFNGTARESGCVVQGDGWTIHATEENPDALDGASALATVRPEAISLTLTRPDDSENTISGTLVSVSHRGDVIQFVVRTPGHKEVVARVPRPSAPRLEPGTEVWCWWDPEHAHVFSAEQTEIVLAGPAEEAAPALA